ncbi:KilA-N domain-containing protein [Roseicella aerolata]|uniref:KilA-N domain-containing protein n=1 Tax=Roseicella aerolata TaxID=2883479 RepID=A0A9X1IJK0_9PROT|nr:KilA-N domain-containing protein [Roseicella aerolata]MCB4825329.1 KilA-N domain-containing protein [Roseicella aerolata]
MTTTLSYQGSPIRFRGAMLNLTDMWQAANRPPNRRPSDWLALEETGRFRTHAGTHASDADDLFAPNAGLAGICHLDTDGLVATVRGHQGGTWAHWQLALTYARYLSPPFHLWCNTVVRTAMQRPDEAPAAGQDPLRAHLDQQFQRLHRRLDILDVLDRHAADLMFLQLSAQDLLLGARRNFSALSQAAITRAVAAEPFGGRCPCCDNAPVLTEAGRPVAGAEFDHFFHRGLNRPEHGWLICADCHIELTRSGYLLRFSHMPRFRAFQAAVLEQRRHSRMRHSSTTE